jgi:hypothetical protein
MFPGARRDAVWRIRLGRAKSYVLRGRDKLRGMLGGES